jgi:hypothetical protein
MDHEVEVSLNGGPVETLRWSGIALHEETLTPALLQGNNTISLEATQGLDVIYVDTFFATFPSRFETSGNTLVFSHAGGSRYQVSGYTESDILVYDITSPGEVEGVTGLQITGDGTYTVEFEPAGATGQRTYLVFSSNLIKTPVGISQDTASDLSGTTTQADYLLITHRDLGWDGNGDPYVWLTRLVELRDGQGLEVEVVDLEDILDEFSFGILTPQAIKDFLSHAYANWTKPALRYVLIVGDGSYDPKNNRGLDESPYRYVPGYLAETPFLGETVADDWFSQISGDDAVPDLYMGRLPASTADQAAVMVGKILAYEEASNTKTWEKETVLIADNTTEAWEGVFEEMNETGASLLPASFNTPYRGYLNDYAFVEDLTADIKTEINGGALIVHYSGHGSTRIWANEWIFENDDVPDLTNDQALPFVISMSCLVGYFADPEPLGYHSLAETLLRSEDRGRVAGFVPTGMTTTPGQEILSETLFEAIFTDDIRTLGPAVSQAKQTLLANGAGYEEVSETFLLLGDPAMRLKVPVPRRPTTVSVTTTDEGTTVSWQAAEDAEGDPVSGYNLYRRTTPGGTATKLNTDLLAETTYLDPEADGGVVYYYTVTSVDSDGDESVPSAQTSTPAPPAPVSGSSNSGCFISAVGRR